MLQAGQCLGSLGGRCGRKEDDKLLLADAPDGILRAQGGAHQSGQVYQGRSLGLRAVFGFQRRQLVNVQRGQCDGLGLALVAGGFGEQGFLQALGIERAGLRVVAGAVFHAKQCMRERFDLLFLGLRLLPQIGQLGLHDAVFCGQSAARVHHGLQHGGQVPQILRLLDLLGAVGQCLGVALTELAQAGHLFGVLGQ